LILPLITLPSLKNDVIYGRPKKGLPKCNKGKKGKKRKNDCCMDIVVVGAGVAGLAAAGLLSKAGTVNQN
jgi:NADPH-dependent 2,4-dienoyl-CoA reductase/sulfur reductase-like enzyme